MEPVVKDADVSAKAHLFKLEAKFGKTVYYHK